MKERNTFSVLFYQRVDKIDKKGMAPIFMRVTVNGRRVEIATNKNFDVERWKDGKPTDNKIDAKELLRDLESMKERINRIRRNMIDHDEMLDVKKIKEYYTGKSQKSKTVVEVFDWHNALVKELLDKQYSQATYTRYLTTLSHIKEFMMNNYSVNDMRLTELNYDFIASFDHYLKVKRGCNHNSSMKYIKNFRKVINLAVKHGWIDKDPFALFKCNILPVERFYLTSEELKRIEDKEIEIKRMDQVRDIFVFCCYTGLAYCDVSNLMKEHIVIGIDGLPWINQNREKTDIKAQIPLLPKALEILDKYKDISIGTNRLLPVIANSNYNAYLKELAAICEIQKNLTSHIARHTFATTVTLSNDVPIESVSKMLAHKSLRTTQIYAKIVEKKVSDDMAKLRMKLGSEK
ncbi:MAG TPA: site-specific integrase [Bacteroidales bacterium]|nr:site-specific integrase [Bacteroidales bacterium]